MTPNVIPMPREPLPNGAAIATKGKKTLPNSTHGRVIPEYVQEEARSTQESTAIKKTPLSQVEVTFLEHFDDAVSGASSDDWSFGSDWLGSLEEDCTDSDESEDWKIDCSSHHNRFFPVDGNDLSFEDWVDTPESYRNVALTGP